LVIRYAYLWKREWEQGREEGSKDRPCAVVLVLGGPAGRQDVAVLPITHSQPSSDVDAIEVPFETKRRLGLDSDRSWVVVSESNRFTWPGPDLRTIPGKDISTVEYGMLPKRFLEHVLRRFVEGIKQHRSTTVPRTE
jgi:hypothetical protein